MAKIPRWLISKRRLTQEEMESFCCKNESFTCGLLTRLFPDDITRRCKSCIKENLKTKPSAEGSSNSR